MCDQRFSYTCSPVLHKSMSQTGPVLLPVIRKLSRKTLFMEVEQSDFKNYRGKWLSVVFDLQLLCLLLRHVLHMHTYMEQYCVIGNCGYTLKYKHVFAEVHAQLFSYFRKDPRFMGIKWESFIILKKSVLTDHFHCWNAILERTGICCQFFNFTLGSLYASRSILWAGRVFVSISLK